MYRWMEFGQINNRMSVLCDTVLVSLGMYDVG